jgi:hypothetical protein
MIGLFREVARASPAATGCRFGATLALLAICGIVIAPPASAAWPPPMAPAAERADEIHVVKHQRRMDLLRRGKVIRSYNIRLGDQPRGHKRQQGDERTPEGRYTITYRNPKSAFHLSLRISYPNAADRAQARARGIDPGGDIVIHGGTPPGYWRIALTDRQMEDVWSRVPTGTPIVIDP